MNSDLNVKEYWKEAELRHVNISEEICSGWKSWLKQNELILIENDKGRATCIISKIKRDQLIEKELSNKERYKLIPKDDIEIVKTKINKELAILRKDDKISIECLKKLKQITPITPSARATLKAHKDPLKVRLIINTKGSAFYHIAKFVNNELKPLTTTAASFIKDTEEFANKIKGEKMEDREN